MTQWTRDAFPAMLTGRYPSRALPPHHRSYPDNLFTLLDGPYQLLCPRHCSAGAAQPAGRPAGAGPWRALRRSCALVAELASPWEREQQPTAQFEQPVVPTTAPPGHTGTAATRPAGFAEFLDGLTPDSPGDHPAVPRIPLILRGTTPAVPRTDPPDSPGDHPGGPPDPPAASPRLHYLHLLLPRRPWRALPSGLRYPEPPRTLGLATKGASWGDEAAWTRLALERHRLQLAWADRLLGEVLTTMRATGLYQRALVVVTADHGISFRPGTHPRVIGRGNAPGIIVGAAVRQGARPAPARGRRPQLGARRRAAQPGHRPAGRPAPPPRGPGPTWGRAGPGPCPPRRPARPCRPSAGRAGRPRRRRSAGHRGGPRRFANVRPSRGEVPALVAGLPPPGRPAGTRLALALNGRVATVAEVAPEGRDHVLRFAGMLGGAGFVAGPNRLEVLVVTDDGLRRLSLRGG